MEDVSLLTGETGEHLVAEEPKPKKKDKAKEKEKKDEVSQVKIELALYRAQMSMVRTTTTMTTFGFALHKLLQEKAGDGKDRPILHTITPKMVALTLFFAGFLGLATYTVKHIIVLKRFNWFKSRIYFSGLMLMTYVILILTLFLFIGTWKND